MLTIAMKYAYNSGVLKKSILHNINYSTIEVVSCIAHFSAILHSYVINPAGEL